MTNLRHLAWMSMAAIGLLFSTSQGYAQTQDPGDQPGLVADDNYALDPKWQKQVVFYRTSEAPGTIIVSTSERFLYVVQPGGRALRYGIGVGRDGFQWQGLLQDHTQAGMAGLDAAAGNDPAPALSAALHGRRPRQPARRARALSRQPRSIASTAPTSRRRSAPRCRPAASAWSIRDVIDLYDRVPVGTKVIVRQRPQL